MVHASTSANSQLAQVVFRPPRSTGVAIGLAIAVGTLAFALVALRTAANGGTEFKTFLAWLTAALLLVVAAAFVNWTHGIATMAYVIDGDALVIRWGFRRVEIPIDTILRLVPGRTLDPAHIRGINWPGCHIGHAEVKRIGYTLFYSTHRMQSDLVIVHTTQESYALSLVDQAGLAEEIQSRTVLGSLESHPQRSAASGIAALPFWRDGHAISATLLAVFGAVLTCGFVMYRYPGLPEIIELTFPASGGLAVVGEKSELLKIVYLGAAISAVNIAVGVALHARERAAGLWAFASAALLQGVLFAAAVAAIERA
ncbi:MAG: PH domain-containing protein [Dehalococcoidia bacterium]|nr:hypothetical protein [Dehalococcoidia bacterium]MCB9485374.1 hypothetical protein [Thermoflexaceae bacterium]